MGNRVRSATPATTKTQQLAGRKPSERKSSSRRRAKNVAGEAIPRCFFDVVPEGGEEGSIEDRKLRLTRRILFLARRWGNLLDESLRATGDSYATWVTLLWVGLLDGRGNIGELADHIGVEIPTLVRLLNRVEKEGLVERRSLRGSNRDKTVVLTAKGKREAAAMRAIVQDTRGEFLKDVDEARLDVALNLLNDVMSKYVRIDLWPAKLG